jgi:DNA-binding response OmpR family regulator
MHTSIKNICIIEDEQDIADAMRSFFEKEGYSVVVFYDARSFFAGIPKSFKGIYLVDWKLPGMNGGEIIKKIREKDHISPIFIISAFSQSEQVVEGLSAGADDYITKPYDFKELSVRVANSLRKFSYVDAKIIDESEIQLLPEANSFIKDGKTINLTAREYTLFQALFQSKGQPVSREALITHFSIDDAITVRNIDVHVFSLRKKIQVVDLVIDTVWGQGYKLLEFN